MKILVVDDSRAALGLIKDSLKESGFEVLSALDGLEAWQLIKTTKELGVVLSDYNMPGLNGLELAQKVFESEWAGMPFFLITSVGHDVHEMLDTARELGVTAWIVKPLMPEHVELIKQSVEGK